MENAVYYAATSLAPAKPATVLEPIDTPFFRKADKSKDNASYSLWWSTPEDPTFTASEDRLLLDRWFDALDGYGWVLFTTFLRDLELVKMEDKKPVALPERPFLQALLGPGETSLLLHAGEVEGAFFAFDEATTTVARRRTLQRLLANFAENYRAVIKSNSIPMRAQEKGRVTWAEIRDEALEKEAAGVSGLRVHSVDVTDGQPVRSPSAMAPSDRAARPAPPSREILDFAMDLVDRVVARIDRGGVTGSSDDQLGQPNAFPTLALRSAGVVYERQLPFEDAEVAQGAAQRLLHEWPDLEIAALLLDAAIRENGQRVDIFGVMVENRLRGDAASLHQRYRSQNGSLELLVNPSASAEEKDVRSVVYYFDDLVTRDGVPDRRLRLCVQRAGDPETAIFDAPYEAPRKGVPFKRRGPLEFKRWGGALLPAIAASS